MGYRAGIHMKEYGESIPLIVIGTTAGDYLGEYQAGGVIVVLGIGTSGGAVGKHCGTGMHGGVIYIRGDVSDDKLPAQVKKEKLTKEDKEKLAKYVADFCENFGYNAAELLKGKYIKLTPNTKNPYKQLYAVN